MPTRGPTIETVVDLFELPAQGNSQTVDVVFLEGDAEADEHHKGPAALTVVRTSPSGDRSEDRLERQREGIRIVCDGANLDEPLPDPSLLSPTAINALVAEVHPGEITEFWISSAETAEPCDLAARLILTEPSEIDDTAEWTDEVQERLESELRYAGLGSRPVFINGERWFPAPVDGRDAPVLLRQPTDDPEIVEAHETWAHLGFSETASMTSGYDGWSLGRACDKDVLVEFRSPDEDRPWVWCWADSGARKAQAIVGWLTELTRSGDFVFGDLIMAAVETLIGVGASADHWAELPEAAFEDGGSETALYSLALSLDGAEVDEFLDCVSKTGRQDTIDAVREPDSLPGHRRTARLAAFEKESE